MTYHAELTTDGAVPLPADLVAALGLKPGDALSLDQTDGTIIIRRDDGRDAALARIGKAMAGYSIDQFLAERAADSGE